MGAIGEMPAAVAALPASFRRQIARQCGGDWRRVTCEGGAVTVHNQPQRDLHLDTIDPEPVPAAPRPVPSPEPEEKPPLRPLRTTIRPKTADVDTSGFTREELPPVGPPKKRTPRAKPRPETPAPDPAAVRPSPALFASAHRPPVPQVRLLPPAYEAAAEPQPDAPASRRSGTPRTAIEFMKRLLDLGCKFQRLERSDFAKVYYKGNLVEVIRCSDSLTREDVAAEYAKVRDVLRARGWLSQEKQQTTRRSG